MDDIEMVTYLRTGLTDTPLKDEVKKRAMRVVCGAQACRGPEDARLLLDALGLVEER